MQRLVHPLDLSEARGHFRTAVADRRVDQRAAAGVLAGAGKLWDRSRIR